MSPGGITGVVLAGGLGRRMGGADKGLVDYRGSPLAARVIAGFAPQVDEVLVSANRNPDAYAAFGYPVLADVFPDFAGPLAGLHAALVAARHPLVASVPCDSPFFPADLVARLRAALLASDAPLAVAAAGGRLHPVFSLCRREVVADLEAYLAGGGRKMMEWQARVGRVEVEFPDPDAFRNLNTPDDLTCPPNP